MKGVPGLILWINSALNGQSPRPKADRVHEEPRPTADNGDVAQGDAPLPDSASRSDVTRGAILAHHEVAPLLSDEHFSVDGTLVKAWASMKSFQPKAGVTPPEEGGPGDPPTPDDTPETPPEEPRTETDTMPHSTRQNRNSEVDFRGAKRSNATHVSTTDPDARLYKKSSGTGAMLCFMGHALMENRSGLIVQGNLTHTEYYPMILKGRSIFF